MIVSAIHAVGDQTVEPVVCIAKLQISRSFLGSSKMTPLRRWVLLAFLLAAVAAHPLEHACVHLCRARDTSPEKITGVCQHQQKLVLQSSGGRFPIHRLFSLCLSPCHGSSDPLVFDGSHACRTFRETLIQYHGCSCNVDHEGTWNDEEDPWGGEEFEEDRSREMLKEADGEQVPADVRGQGLKIKDLPATKLEAAEVMSDEAGVEDAGTDDADKGASKEEPENVAATGDEANSTDETSVDWDRWCMTQCDNGNGGSACHCDLIP